LHIIALALTAISPRMDSIAFLVSSRDSTL
jgi:hypothetical protein